MSTLFELNESDQCDEDEKSSRELQSLFEQLDQRAWANRSECQTTSKKTINKHVDILEFKCWWCCFVCWTRYLVYISCSSIDSAISQVYISISDRSRWLFCHEIVFYRKSIRFVAKSSFRTRNSIAQSRLSDARSKCIWRIFVEQNLWNNVKWDVKYSSQKQSY